MNKYPRIIISYFFGPQSIPLGFSCARALQALGCEVYCFHSGIHSPVERLLLQPANKILRSLGIKHCDVTKNSSWNTQALRQKLLEKSVVAFKPDILFVIRGHGFDGNYLTYLKNRYGIKKIIGWWVKGPKWFDLMHSESKIYDHFFCIHKEGYATEDKIEYFPHSAVDDLLYRRLYDGDYRQYIHDIVFVGGWTERRQQCVKGLTGYPVAIYGPNWVKKNMVNLRMMPMFKKRGIWGEELVKLYNEAKIALNISEWDTAKLHGINLRVFDISACGTFLLTDYSDGLKEYFRLGEEIETFASADELKDKLSYYLKNDPKREKIALNGYKKVLSLGTYKDKMKDLLNRIWF